MPNEPTNHPQTPPLASGSAAAAQPPDEALTPWQIKTRDRRLRKLEIYHARLAAAFTKAQAAAEAGIGLTSAWHWSRRFQQHGLAGLTPPRHKGRPIAFSSELFSRELILHAQEMCVVWGGTKIGAVKFADDPVCPPAVADYIRRHHRFPEPLRRLVNYRRTRQIVRHGGPFIHVEGLSSTERVA